MSIQDAARELRSRVGRPEWLQSILVGRTDDGREAIILYVAGENRTASELLANGWMGFPVLVKVVGPFVAIREF